MDSLVLTCKGILKLHEDSCITCSVVSCWMRGSVEEALDAHSAFVVCHDPDCSHCIGGDDQAS